MASKKAVRDRTNAISIFEQSKREFFEEGISSSKAFLNKERPGAEDLIDWMSAGIRSAMAYTGARNIKEFQYKAVVGIQSAAGFSEGQALETSWV
jgi:IMP dehydrogenase